MPFTRPLMDPPYFLESYFVTWIRFYVHNLSLMWFGSGMWPFCSLTIMSRDQGFVAKNMALLHPNSVISNTHLTINDALASGHHIIPLDEHNK